MLTNLYRLITLSGLLVSLTFSMGAAGDLDLQYKINPSETLTIRDCINIALGRSPTHLKTLETLSESRYDLLSSYGVYTPTISLNHLAAQTDFTTFSFQNPDGTVSRLPQVVEFPTTFVDSLGFVRAGPTVQDTIPIVSDLRRFNQRQLSFNLTFFAGGRNIFNIFRARAQKHANEFAVDASQLQVVANVSEKYFNTLRAQRLLELNKKILEQRKDQLRLAEARYHVGSVTKLDVLQAKIDKQKQDLLVLRAENDIIAAKMELNRAMGIDINQTAKLQDEFEVFEPDFDVEELIRFAMDNNPTIKQLESQEAAFAKQVWIERGSYLPTLTASGTIGKSQSGRRSDSFFEFNPQNEVNNFAMNINWEFYAGFSKLAGERKAQATLNNTRHDLYDAELSTESNMRQAYLELMRIYQNTLTMADNRELATQQLELASERYRLGSADILELRAAQSLFSQAEYDYISSIFDFHIALARLSQTVGRDLTQER